MTEEAEALGYSLGNRSSFSAMVLFEPGASLTEAMVTCFREAEQCLQISDADRVGYVKLIGGRGEKKKTYKTSKRFWRNDSWQDVTSLSCHVLVPEYDQGDVRPGWFALLRDCGVNIAFNCGFVAMELFLAEGSSPEQEARLDRWLRGLMDCRRVIYGFSLHRKVRYMPQFYMHGIIYGLSPLDFSREVKRERDRITCWREVNHSALHRFGYLAAVHRWNFLTAAQLDAAVFDTTLRGWIEADASRGRLEPFVPERGVWRWVVEPGTEERLEDELHRAGRVLTFDEAIDVIYDRGLAKEPRSADFVRSPAWFAPTRDPVERFPGGVRNPSASNPRPTILNGCDVDKLAHKLAADPALDAEFVLVGKPLSVLATEEGADLCNDDRVVDVVVVGRDGRVHLFDVAWPTLRRTEVEAKLASIMAKLPNERRGRWQAVDPA
jgi:hypothetical protein